MSGSKQVGKLAQAVARGTGASQTTSATPTGRAEPTPEQRQRLIEAINQVFALFRLNYHNQFFAAYPAEDDLNHVRRLWLDALADYPIDVILRGARTAIERNDYLPTLNRMLEACRQSLTDIGLSAPRDAYLEACAAPSPKADYAWSHPAVYLAGRDSDWFYLANNTERVTWPVFRDHYENYLMRASRGETHTIPERKALPQQKTTPMSDDERLTALAELRREMGF